MEKRRKLKKRISVWLLLLMIVIGVVGFPASALSVNATDYSETIFGNVDVPMNEIVYYVGTDYDDRPGEADIALGYAMPRGLDYEVDRNGYVHFYGTPEEAGTFAVLFGTEEYISGSDATQGSFSRTIVIQPADSTTTITGIVNIPMDEVVYCVGVDETSTGKAEIVSGKMPNGLRYEIDDYDGAVRFVGTPKEAGTFYVDFYTEEFVHGRLYQGGFSRTIVVREYTQLNYEVIAGTKTVKITGVKNPDEMPVDLIIPPTVNVGGEDYKVVEIADIAFSGCGFTGDLVIPNSVTTIGEAAFNECNFTGDLVIPNSVTTIGEWAFCECGFTGKLVIPDSVTTIGDYAFSHAVNGYSGDLVIPNSVTRLGQAAFYGSSFTGELVIPDSITTIGDYMFYDCGFTGELMIPDSVTKVGEYAFYGCDFAGDLIIPKSVTTIGCDAFADCGFNGKLVIPNSVTTIDDAAFSGCGFTGDLVIPNSITAIDASVFYECGFNGKLVIPDSVTTIGFCAFAGCGFTGELIIPKSVTTIDYSAFARCNFSGNIVIPRSVEKLGAYVFRNCTNITTLTIPCKMDYSFDYGISRDKVVKEHNFLKNPEKCSECGFYADSIGAKLAGYSLSLHDNIGVNFYMELSDVVVYNIGAKFVAQLPGGVCKEIPVSEAKISEVNGKTYYVFDCQVSAKEMTDTITAKIVLSDGSEGTEYQFTVQDYAKYILEHPSQYENEMPVVKALLNYGTSTQKYFNYNTGKMANSILSDADKKVSPATPDLSAYNFSSPSSTDKISYIGTSLLLKSEVGFKCYFDSSTTLTTSNISVKCGDKTIDASRIQIGKEGNIQYVLVTGLSPIDYGKQFTINANGLTVSNVSIYGYMSKAFNSSSGNDALNLVLKNMYAYGQACIQAHK